MGLQAHQGRLQEWLEAFRQLETSDVLLQEDVQFYQQEARRLMQEADAWYATKTTLCARYQHVIEKRGGVGGYYLVLMFAVS